MTKNIIAILEPQTKYSAIPIKIYNIVHTGPKIQLGGLNEGLDKDLYHELIDLEVHNPEIRPTHTHDIIEIVSLKKFITINYIINIHN